MSPTQETSFYYKESSLSSKESRHKPGKIKDVACQVHKVASTSSSCDDESSCSEAANSYVSRISQQVFVEDSQPLNMKKRVASFFSSVSKYKGNTKL